MFGLKLTGVTYEFLVEDYKKAFLKYVEDQARLAARDFATTALSRIPIRTGFVAGSFGTLTDLVGSGARLNPIISFTRKVLRAARDFLAREGRVSKPKIPSTVTGEYYYPPGGGKVLKTTSSGQQFATQKDDIFKWVGSTFIFKYEVDITYFRINDSIPGHVPTAPWQAFVAAQKAFEVRMDQVGLHYDIQIEKFFKPIPI